MDNVSTESEIAGDSAAKFAKGTLKGADNEISVKPGTLVRYMENCAVCPFGVYAAEHNIHACGSLCEVIEFNDNAKAVEIVENWTK